MWETGALCVTGVIMAAMYSRTSYPKLYALFNTAAGALSLIASETVFSGGLEGITPYSAALSVILGVPGTIAHRLLQMM
ncbi:MAG: hypothetical protein IK093_09775 [Ruminiclostridium sp.]|nr:hypothetical protein [Ruminiclostridium sp.]